MRKRAREAGRPWPEDQPKRDPHEGQYLGDDGQWHDRSERRRPLPAAAQLALAAGLLTFNRRR